MNWALAHTVPGSKDFYNGFTQDDCADFASRSLAFGGGLPEDVAPFPPLQKHNDSYWYQYHAPALTSTSNSWANSYHMANFFAGQGSYFLKHANNAKPGYIIFVQWKHQGWKKIDHAE